MYEPFDSVGMYVYHSQIAENDKGEAFVLAKLTDWTTHNFRLLKYNEVSELQYSTDLVPGTTGYQSDHEVLELTFTPDGNLIAFTKMPVGNLPNGLTNSGAENTFVLAKINPADGSYIWSKAFNPFTDAN